MRKSSQSDPYKQGLFFLVLLTLFYSISLFCKGGKIELF